MPTHRLMAIGAGVVATIALSSWTGAQSTPDRAADREAIRAHVDRIFSAYIAKSRSEVVATHGQHWIGFLLGSRRPIRGIDDYMAAADRSLSSPLGMRSYEMTDFEIEFLDDAVAAVAYVADTQRDLGEGPRPFKLRVLDVYRLDDGRWIQVASSTAPHPDAWPTAPNAAVSRTP